MVESELATESYQHNKFPASIVRGDVEQLSLRDVTSHIHGQPNQASVVSHASRRAANEHDQFQIPNKSPSR